MTMTRQIVDAHHHLWEQDVLHYPWLSKPLVHPLPGLGDISRIQRDYTAKDFLLDTSAVDLVGSVHVEALVRPDLADAEDAWLNSVADEHAIPTAIVSFLDLLSDGAFARAEDLTQKPRIAGVRQVLNWDGADATWNFASEDMLRLPALQEIALHLARLRLRFDAQVWHQQFADLARLSDKTSLQIAIDHCGMPRSFDPEYLSAWSDALSVFADTPFISMKFSGMTMFRRDWTADTARHIFDRLVDVFGPCRLMFGSNFPVDRIGLSYGGCIERAERLVADHAPDFAQRFFVTNAARFYGFEIGA